MGVPGRGTSALRRRREVRELQGVTRSRLATPDIVHRREPRRRTVRARLPLVAARESPARVGGACVAAIPLDEAAAAA
jgi:hypothetical protein